MSHPQDYDTTRIALRRVADEGYVPPVDIPVNPEDEAPYKNEVVVNSYSSPSGVGSASGLYLRVGSEERESIGDNIIRIGKVIVTNDTPGSTYPTVAYRAASGETDLLETGELWFRTSDQGFFVHDGTKYVRVSPVEATEEEAGIIRIATDVEVLQAIADDVAVTPQKLEEWKEDRELLSRVREGRLLYVNQSTGDDALENDGLDSYAPFLTLERALIEVARRSYVPGADNDLYRHTTIFVTVGDYLLDNRPGATQIETLYTHDYGDVGAINPIDTGFALERYDTENSTFILTGEIGNLVKPNTQIFNREGASAIVVAIDGLNVRVRRVKGAWLPQDPVVYPDYSIFNSPNGGVIIPRGCSVIGIDLRKCVVRPRYVGDFRRWLESLGECSCSVAGMTARLRMTGASYLANLTFADNPEILSTHHLVTAVEFVSTNDLTSSEYGYYRKVSKVLGRTLLPPIATSEYQENPLEYSIVTEADGPGQRDPDGFDPLNTVDGASPYISNCSLLSRFGAKGLKIDGAVVEGFKSFVVERFTNVSLQEDPDAFAPDPAAPDGKVYRGPWRHASYEALNDGYGQLVSCFTICSADHYRVESGGELSLANCFTNFGDVAFTADGYSNTILEQDTGATISRIIPPKPISNDEQEYPLSSLDPTGTSSSRVYTSSEINLDRIRPFTLIVGDYIYIRDAEGNEFSARIAEGIYGTEPGGRSYFAVDPLFNDIVNNVADLQDFPIYIKRRPDLRLQEDKIYWLEVEGVTRQGQRPPQPNYILRFDEELMANLQLPKTLFVGIVRDKDTDDVALAPGTYQIALLSADGPNDNLEAIFPTGDINAPVSNPLNSLTYRAVNTVLDALGISDAKRQSLLQPGSQPIDIRNDAGNALVLYVKFARPSTIRAFGTGIEWVGFGNYSSALPKYQTVTFDITETLAKVKQELNGGRVYNVGMTQDGQFILGDRILDLRTGEETNTKALEDGDTQVFKNLIVTKKLTMYPNSTLDLSVANITIDNLTRFTANINTNALTYATTQRTGFVRLAEITDRTSPELVVTAAQLGALQNDPSYYATTTTPGVIRIATDDDLTSNNEAFTPAAAAILPDKPSLYATVSRAGFLRIATVDDLTSPDEAFTPAAAAVLPDKPSLYATTDRAGFLRIATIDDLTSDDEAFTPAAAADLKNKPSMYATTLTPGFVILADTLSVSPSDPVKRVVTVDLLSDTLGGVLPQYATTTEAGIIRIATLADLESADEVFTPAAAALLPTRPQLYASTTAYGFVRLATSVNSSSDVTTPVFVQDMIDTSIDAIQLPVASESTVGIIKLATSGEVNAGSLSVAISPGRVTPLVEAIVQDAIGAIPDVVFPTASESVAGIVRLSNSSDVSSDSSTTAISPIRVKSLITAAVSSISIPTINNASETVTGIVRLATSSDVSSDSSSTAISPLRVKSMITSAIGGISIPTISNATETVTGIVRLATASDVSSESSSTAISPLRVKSMITSAVGGISIPTINNATESVVGIVRLASSSDVNSESTTVAISPGRVADMIEDAIGGVSVPTITTATEIVTGIVKLADGNDVNNESSAVAISPRRVADMIEDAIGGVSVPTVNTATEAVVGIVRLANASDVASDSSAVAISPNRVSDMISSALSGVGSPTVNNASETQRGIIEIADATEIVAGNLSTDKALTPARASTMIANAVSGVTPTINYANTTTAGIIRIANNTDPGYPSAITDEAMTPALVTALLPSQATSSVQGTVVLATSGFSNYNDDTRAVTPKLLGEALSGVSITPTVPLASLTEPGIVKLARTNLTAATNGNAVGQDNDYFDTAVTPNLVGEYVPAASETVAGKVQLASSGTLATNTLLAVTPALVTAFVAASSTTTAGKIKLASSGLVSGNADFTAAAVPPSLVPEYVPNATVSALGKVKLTNTAITSASPDWQTTAVTPKLLSDAIAGVSITPTIPNASTTQAGIVQLATALTPTTNALLAVTPNLVAGFIPAASTSVEGKVKLTNTLITNASADWASTASTPKMVDDAVSAAIAALPPGTTVFPASTTTAGIVKLAVAGLTAVSPDNDYTDTAVTPNLVAGYVPDATTTTAGKVLLTDALTPIGNNSKAVTPNMVAGYVPQATDAIAGKVTLATISTPSNSTTAVLTPAVVTGFVALGSTSVAGRVRLTNTTILSTDAGWESTAVTPKLLSETVSNAVSASPSGVIPVGGIIMWTGLSVPSGWWLCDGSLTPTNIQTPDLRDRFILGASGLAEYSNVGPNLKYPLNFTGGQENVTLTTEQIPSHRHVYELSREEVMRLDQDLSGTNVGVYPSGTRAANVANNDADNADNEDPPALPGDLDYNPSYQTGATGGNASGVTQPHTNIPPYYALAFIMRYQ